MALDSNLKVDVMKTLSVFNCILDKGDKLADGHYLYSGIQAKHDAEGYTLTLFDSEVKLNIYFHNKYAAQFENRSKLDFFLKKLDTIYQKHH